MCEKAVHGVLEVEHDVHAYSRESKFAIFVSSSVYAVTDHSSWIQVSCCSARIMWTLGERLTRSFTWRLVHMVTLTSVLCMQGLAVGFVLLRFEALVEEGKLDDVLK